METKGTGYYIHEMPYEIELIFQDHGLQKFLRGKFKVDQGLLVVTAEDGRRKTSRLSGDSADAMARSMLHEMELEKHH